MKSQNFWKWTAGLSLGVLPFAGGCLQENSSPPVQTASAFTASPEPAVVYQAAPAEPVKAEATAAPTAPAEAAGTNPAEAPVQVVSAGQPAPAKVNLTPASAELVKMANSGVEEQVMLAYVTNSPSTFNLGAEEIIYMNDLGVPGAVITAMIQRDHVLQAAGAAAMAASAQANVPQPTQPAPETVAPQATEPTTYAAETPPPPPQEEVVTSTFYDSMAPYGTWVSVSGYGYCWRPTVAAVNVGWAPYYDGGHWVYTDWGWYWVSDYSWGWAPFHYGRWFHHNHWGWCWAPDTVWGPSWVSWRYSSAYCGWAPLPPGAYFSFGIGLTFHGSPCHDWYGMGVHPSYGHFVAWRDFDRHDLHRHGVPLHERDAAYRNTVVVNNISIDNRTVINRGVPRERVTEVTHREVRPVTVRETTGSNGRPVGGRREQLRGDTLTVYRPAMPPGGGEGRAAGTGSPRNRPEFTSRNSAASAPSAASSPSAPVVGETGRGESRAVNEPNRTRTSPNRIGEGTVTRPASRPGRALESPAEVSRETRSVPATRQPAGNDAASRSDGTRSAPQVIRTPQTAPTQRSSEPAAREPARQPAQQAQPTPAPSRPPAQAPRSSLAPSSSPATARPAASAERSVTVPQRSYAAPTYTAPQRSYTSPSTTPREAYSVPRQTTTAPQVPRYAPAPAQPSYTAPPQRTPSTPSYSRTESAVPRSPQPSAPAMSAPASAPAPQPAAPASRSSSGSDNGRGNRQR